MAYLQEYNNMALSRMNDAFKKRAAAFLETHLPNRTKRLVFLASLTARLKGSETFDQETLHKLNKVMILSSSDSALKLPVQLSRAIWHGKTSYEIFNAELDATCSLNQAYLKELASRVISAMPAWLRYASDDAIEHDVEQLLENRSIVLG